MAYKDSEELKTDERYPLGDYSFRIERSSVPGSANDKIESICTDKDGKNARKSIQIPSSAELLGWYVEANGTEATVYANIKKNPTPGPIPGPIPYVESFQTDNQPDYPYYDAAASIYSGARFVAGPRSRSNWYFIAAAENYGVCYFEHYKTGSGGTIGLNYSYTYNNKTVWYQRSNAAWSSSITCPQISSIENAGPIAWMMVYGDDEEKDGEVIIGRFAIDIEDAGGVGPGGGTGGGWTDPEDYDEDWEEGDPTHTLYVTVTGALSGRHNDPIVDPSYSYIPADKDTVKDYGCGGDGGHGGGGGAGASTVVVYKFATNQANSKEVTAVARRHGYGSGGGKGGKGGDGCILVYY